MKCLCLCLLIGIGCTTSSWSQSVSASATWEEKVVAAVIMGEARGEGESGMIAVGEVIHQRSVERHQTPVRVVTDKGEFASKVGKTAVQMVQSYSKERGYATALRVAHLVCHCPDKLPGITKSANYFDNKGRHPWWASSGVRVATIGNHVFYRVPN